MQDERWLRLEAIRFHAGQLWILAELCGHPFTTAVWYGDVDLDQLAAALGPEPFARLAFHIAAFEINKLCSLMPTHLSFGPYARFVTPTFLELWSTVLHRVWAQWRYEHNLPDWKGPVIVDPPVASATLPVCPALCPAGAAEVLLYFGGGKDSLVAAQLLERAAVPYATATYAHSAYGSPAPQLALIDALLDRLVLIWARTGEDVNHQWGKSWAAETALATYIERELVPGFHWFSILQPPSDVLIFELLRDAGPAVRFTHSCNVKKPWCLRCAKCAYVALGYVAHLPDGVYEQIFRIDVLDLPENELYFRQMIGLGEHTPFECIGEVGEARLALSLCHARGRRARAVDLYVREVGAIDVTATLNRYARVHTAAPHGIPESLARSVLPAMHAAQRRAWTRIGALVDFTR